jgi:gamma-glutamyltranspeptidase/glutathione hydrolase
MDNLPLDPYGRSASGRNGAVAAATFEASKVGVAILRAGGNAVDAAVAGGFVNGVLEPNANGLGGGGFMIIKLAGMVEAVVIDFREAAPKGAVPTMFKVDDEGHPAGDATITGGLAAGVPGETAGLLCALEQFGSRKLTRAQILQPAIDFAAGGFPVSANLSSHLQAERERLNRFPASAAIYLPEGQLLPPGAWLRNPDAARTLELIAARGRDAFYRGPVAERIAAEVQRTGGIMTLEDLAAYEPRIRQPILGSYRGCTLLTVPLASAGGIHLVELLNVMETFDLAKTGAGTAGTLHLWAEALRQVFAGRARYLADRELDELPWAGLTAKAHARELAARIAPGRLAPRSEEGGPVRPGPGCTTHLSVMDQAGNMAAVTKTLNNFFGCAVTVPGTGILLNDTMDDFVPSPGSVNSVGPGKRPFSSCCPTLVLDPEGRPFLSVGSPGSLRIFPTVAQILSNVIDFGMNIAEAINAPRLFQADRGELEVEGRISVTAYNGLVGLGHSVLIREDWDKFFGGAQAVLLDPGSRILTGSGDPRRDGRAAAF